MKRTEGPKTTRQNIRNIKNNLEHNVSSAVNGLAKKYNK